VIPRRRVDVIRDSWPDAPLTVVPDTAHAPMLERPESFCAAVEGMLARLAG
jgi:pimeloyl-ACP methyl ester carboxylesterase